MEEGSSGGQRMVEEQEHVAHGTPHAQLTPHYTCHIIYTPHTTHLTSHLTHTPFPHNPVSNGVCVAPATGSRAARPRPGSGCAPRCSRSRQPQQCTGECGPGLKRTSAQGDNSGVQITSTMCLKRSLGSFAYTAYNNVVCAYFVCH